MNTRLTVGGILKTKPPRGLPRRAYQGLLVLLGGIAVIAGSATVLFGVDSIVGAGGVSATVDSEMRFYAVWYVGAGALLLWAAGNMQRSHGIVRGLAVLLFVAGSSRALSWVAVGEPHGVAQALMAIELVLPLVILPWQAAIERGQRLAGGDLERVREKAP